MAKFLVFEKLRCAFRVCYLMRFGWIISQQPSEFSADGFGRKCGYCYVYECMYAYICVYSVNKIC